MSNEDCVEGSGKCEHIDNRLTAAIDGLTSNDLIVENIMRFMRPSQLKACSRVCRQWRDCARIARSKLVFINRQSFYFTEKADSNLPPLVSGRPILTSMCELRDAINSFAAANEKSEFAIALLFCRLDNARWKWLTDKGLNPFNDCVMIYINTDLDVIDPEIGPNINSQNLESISGLFVSRDMPGVDVRAYRDSDIYDMSNRWSVTKCVLVFHTWISRFGHFNRLKAQNDCVEYLEKLVDRSPGLAVAGITDDQIRLSHVRRKELSELSEGEIMRESWFRFNHMSCDNICCVTFSGDNVLARSAVIDMTDTDFEGKLTDIKRDIQSWSLSGKTETVAFVFGQELDRIAINAAKFVTADASVIYASGVPHGRDSLAPKSSSDHRIDKLFYRKGKCALAWISVKKL